MLVGAHSSQCIEKTPCCKTHVKPESPNFLFIFQAFPGGAQHKLPLPPARPAVHRRPVPAGGEAADCGGGAEAGGAGVGPGGEDGGPGPDSRGRRSRSDGAGTGGEDPEGAGRAGAAEAGGVEDTG
jgi:hypothetical protein